MRLTEALWRACRWQRSVSRGGRWSDAVHQVHRTQPRRCKTRRAAGSCWCIRHCRCGTARAAGLVARVTVRALDVVRRSVFVIVTGTDTPGTTGIGDAVGVAVSHDADPPCTGSQLHRAGDGGEDHECRRDGNDVRLSRNARMTTLHCGSQTSVAPAHRDETPAMSRSGCVRADSIRASQRGRYGPGVAPPDTPARMPTRGSLVRCWLANLVSVNACEVFDRARAGPHGARGRSADPDDEERDELGQARRGSPRPAAAPARPGCRSRDRRSRTGSRRTR